MESTRKGFNQNSIQDMNRTLILNLLRRQNNCARTELAKMSGLKQATVTNIINDFMDWGLVKETGFLTGNKGRRSIGITIDTDLFGVIGVQVARRHHIVGLFDLLGQRVSYIRNEHAPTISPRQIMDDIYCSIANLLEKNDDRKILAIGAALPGPFSIKDGKIELMTGYTGWEEIDIRQEMESRFGLPVILENDANAAAVAQYWNDPEWYENNTLAYICAGEGVGAGILTEGKLFRGAVGTAGEIGHMSINFKGERCACGNRGCLEGYCSTIALTKEVNRILAPERNYKYSDVKRLIREGNPIAIEIFSSCCDYLSIGIVNIINAFNPSVIVIGDEMSHVVPEEMLRRIKRRVKECVVPSVYDSVTIKMSAIDGSMVCGAAIMAVQYVFDRPEKYFNTAQTGDNPD